MLEQGGTVLEKDRHYVQQQRVGQPGLEHPLDDTGTAHDMDLLAARRRGRLRDGRPDALSDEGEGGLAPSRSLRGDGG
jgi:hypothetical protein